MSIWHHFQDSATSCVSEREQSFSSTAVLIARWLLQLMFWVSGSQLQQPLTTEIPEL